MASIKGLPTNPKRIKVIPEWPTQPSIRKIWGLHDLANFYKRFVPYFSIIVAPLIELVRNHVPSWEDAQERGFHTLPYSNIPNTINIYVFILFTDCRNVPFAGERGRGSRVRFPKEERCTESPPTFICGKRRKNWRKPVKKKILSSGVVFTLEEGISTSHICLEGQQPIF